MGLLRETVTGIQISAKTWSQPNVLLRIGVKDFIKVKLMCYKRIKFLTLRM